MLQQQKIDMEPLCKKQTMLEAVVYLGFTAPGNKLSLSAPSRSWQHKIKETLQSDTLVQLYNSKDKVFLPLLLKMYRLYCQTADKI